jgi:hypothetical protein
MIHKGKLQILTNEKHLHYRKLFPPNRFGNLVNFQKDHPLKINFFQYYQLQ